MTLDYGKFKCLDRVIVEDKPIDDEIRRSGTMVSTSGSDARLRAMRVVVGTDAIPAGSVVLVRPGALPQSPIQLGDKPVHVVAVAQVEAWQYPG